MQTRARGRTFSLVPRGSLRAVFLGMSIALVVPSAIAALSIGWLFQSRASRRARVARRVSSLRREWGKAKDVPRDVASAARYHATRAEGGAPGVAAATWRDLGMDAVHAAIDRTLTFAGGARLYDRLRTPAAPLESLRRFDEVATALGDDARAREDVQLALDPPEGPTEGPEEAAILRVLSGELPPPPRVRHAFPLLALLTVGALVASLAVPAARLALLALAVTSIAVRARYGREARGTLEAFRCVNRLLGVGERLARLRVRALDVELEAARGAMKQLATLRRAVSWLLIDTNGENELVAIAIAYANTFLVLDLIAVSFGLDLVHRHRRELDALFAIAGDLDAAVAVASFRAGLPRFVRPELVPGAVALELEGAVHPLVAGAVPNGIRVEGRGALVTGGNMTGKSTFVRTVAINALLAQTIYTTTATRYRAPVLRVRALMTASDDVQRNRSYYYAELEGAKALIEPEGADAAPTRTLVVLDELFRGTNTSERIAAGKAVLDALARAGHFVFASTHDGELVGLLAASFDPYHFGEDIVGGELVFPYDLRKGPATTRNAIALMAIAGFPAAVVADAASVIEKLERATAT